MLIKFNKEKEIKKQDFFYKQSNVTELKIEFFENYMEKYLSTVIYSFGKCRIFDLFSGNGKNGEKDGSPLILLKMLEKIINNKTVREKHKKIKIEIFFNDYNPENVSKLKLLLEKYNKQEELFIYGPFCYDFQKIIKEVEKFSKKDGFTNFFFLDPFGYNVVKTEDLKFLIEYSKAEIMLFLPTFHSYRFLKSGRKSIDFIENFIGNYENINDIYSFNDAIKNNLFEICNAKYVNVAGLDGRNSKNALFLITNHVLGMIYFNEILWKYSENGYMIDISKNKQLSLFDNNICEKKELFKEKLILFFKNQEFLSNVDLIEFATKEGIDLKFLKTTVKNMIEKKLITFDYILSEKRKGLYLSKNDWKNKYVYFFIKKGKL